MALATSFPRFLDFPDFRPTIGGDEFIANGLKGGTLFYRRINSLTKDFIDPTNYLVSPNMNATYDNTKNYITQVAPVRFLGDRPVEKIDTQENLPWALWYYMFCKGRRTQYDRSMIDYRKRVIKDVYLFLSTQDADDRYEQTYLPAITQLLLELGHARNYSPTGIRMGPE